MARAGTYPEAISIDVSPERLKKYFTKEENQYQVKKTIREMVVFAPQNITKDPPFTKLDLLCCRNLLIYFGSELQEQLIPIFHYSLKPESLLFLGTSETIGQFTDLFSFQEKKWKIFKGKPTETAVQPIPNFPIRLPNVQPPMKNTPKLLKKTPPIDTLQLVKSILSQSKIHLLMMMIPKVPVFHLFHLLYFF